MAILRIQIIWEHEIQDHFDQSIDSSEITKKSETEGLNFCLRFFVMQFIVFIIKEFRFLYQKIFKAVLQSSLNPFSSQLNKSSLWSTNSDKSSINKFHSS